MKNNDLRRNVLVERQNSPVQALVGRYRAAGAPVKRAIIFTLLAVIGIVSAASAYSYTVQQGDTLSRIARDNNTTVDAIVQENNIANPNLIHTGQILSIPETIGSSSATMTSTTVSTGGMQYVVHPGDTLYKIAVRYGTTLEAIAAANHLTNVNKIYVGQLLTIPVGGTMTNTPTSAFPPATSNITGVPITPATTETNPVVTQDYACTRFNFLEGRDRTTGARAGTYVLVNADNGPIASWVAAAGAHDSGWINNIPIPFTSIHTKVVFYPADSTQPPVQMEIVNPAPGTTYGWLTRELCHATEIQFPAP